MSAQDKPLRADAARNRARLLEAAEQVFAERGTGAPVEEVARAAGVGVGTAFRHFPTKESLLSAVYLARLERLGDRAAGLAEADDPVGALRTFFAETVEQAASKNALAEALSAAGVDPRAAASATGARLREALGGLLHRAQQAGVRPELTVADLMSLLIGASRAVEPLAADPAARARVIGVILDGLTAA
ncbi:TetR/AcrR family transcriptional regulator [Catellatospora tritici]|uniref:TetR/AcrR family transcriptional regulator n=1 Tax=Catellatospora tritici TaxID=2851566 RepID=UPI001C2CD95E|nr:TetR/AcrR family transcriptional regulator [Catellatospora tritici]MBV1854757.1 TetR/AcrR family transcriptional regulator; helix-turn-helix transcriptional regulator [Catellatospora tritici]